MTDTTVFNPEAHVAAVLARQQAVIQRIADSAGRSLPSASLPATVDGDSLKLVLVADRNVRWVARWRPSTVDVWECELQRMDTDPNSEIGPYDVSYTVNIVQYQTEFQGYAESFNRFLQPHRPLVPNLQSLRDNPWPVLFHQMQQQEQNVKNTRQTTR